MPEDKGDPNDLRVARDLEPIHISAEEVLRRYRDPGKKEMLPVKSAERFVAPVQYSEGNPFNTNESREKYEKWKIYYAQFGIDLDQANFATKKE